QAGYLAGPVEGGTVGQITGRYPLHVLQQLVDVAADAAIVSEQHASEDHQTEHSPYQPGDDGQLLQRMTEITGAAGNLDQPLDLPGGIEQRQEVREQMAATDPAEGFLPLAGAADAVGNGGAGQIALGDPRGGDAIAGGVKYRGAIDFTKDEHRAQRQLDGVHVALVQRIAHRQADRAADELQVILQALLLELIGLAQSEADAQGGEQDNGQHHEQEQGALQAADAKAVGGRGSCIHFDRVFFSHVYFVYMILGPWPGSGIPQRYE